ncbi:MAG TPA: response regulator [Verrucomicrobiae bacterium]|nr:response regulator [Verrucomicrobiae bacterium]
MKRHAVLVIEDCPQNQQSLHDALQSSGYSVTTMSDAERALSTVEDWAKQYHLVIIQEAMSGRSGLELLREARSRRKDLPVVVITRDGDWNGYARALSEGAVDYFPTPVNREELLRAVEGALA